MINAIAKHFEHPVTNKALYKIDALSFIVGMIKACQVAITGIQIACTQKKKSKHNKVVGVSCVKEEEICGKIHTNQIKPVVRLFFLFIYFFYLKRCFATNRKFPHPVPYSRARS